MLDRLRRAATQVVTEEAMQQADALLGDVATRVVEDGRFMAAATPWPAEDGKSVVNRASISGAAYVERAGGGFTLVLCDDAPTPRLLAGFAAGGSAATVAQQAGQPVPTGEGAPENPFIGEYPLASTLVRGSAGGSHVRVQSEAAGYLRLTAVSEELWVGTVTLSLPQAQLAQETESHAVQVAVAFRARPVRSADRPASCRSPGR